MPFAQSHASIKAGKQSITLQKQGVSKGAKNDGHIFSQVGDNPYVAGAGRSTRAGRM